VNSENIKPTVTFDDQSALGPKIHNSIQHPIGGKTEENRRLGDITLIISSDTNFSKLKFDLITYSQQGILPLAT